MCSPRGKVVVVWGGRVVSWKSSYNRCSVHKGREETGEHRFGERFGVKKKKKKGLRRRWETQEKGSAGGSEEGRIRSPCPCRAAGFLHGNTCQHKSWSWNGSECVGGVVSRQRSLHSSAWEIDKWWPRADCISVPFQPGRALGEHRGEGKMPVVWPTLLDLSRDECKRILRKLGTVR